MPSIPGQKAVEVYKRVFFVLVSKSQAFEISPKRSVAFSYSVPGFLERTREGNNNKETRRSGESS